MCQRHTKALQHSISNSHCSMLPYKKPGNKCRPETGNHPCWLTGRMILAQATLTPQAMHRHSLGDSTCHSQQTVQTRTCQVFHLNRASTLTCQGLFALASSPIGFQFTPQICSKNTAIFISWTQYCSGLQCFPCIISSTLDLENPPQHHKTALEHRHAAEESKVCRVDTSTMYNGGKVSRNPDPEI